MQKWDGQLQLRLPTVRTSRFDTLLTIEITEVLYSKASFYKLVLDLKLKQKLHKCFHDYFTCINDNVSIYIYRVMMHLEGHY